MIRKMHDTMERLVDVLIVSVNGCVEGNGALSIKYYNY